MEKKRIFLVCCENMSCVVSEESLYNGKYFIVKRGIRVKRIKVIRILILFYVFLEREVGGKKKKGDFF